MNIFRALSQGYGRLNEENLSAMLGFLLAPYEPHGMSDVFLRRFLEAISRKSGNPSYFDKLIYSPSTINAQVVFESAYLVGINNDTRRVDIEIRIYEQDTEALPREIHRIAIENKIQPAAAQANQLNDEYWGIQKKIRDDDEESQITMVFLTPYSKQSKLVSEFDALEILDGSSDQKVWLYWHTEQDEDTICGLIRNILRQETEAHIDPISDYMLHTLKAFVRHIVETVEAPVQKTEFNIGGLIDQVVVQLSIGQYRLERYQSSSIRIFNLDKQEYQEPVTPLLRKIIQEKKLGISQQFDSGKDKNTRTLGKEIMTKLQ